MRELHLHVGLPKTGTSSLQKALLLNRENLRAQGFHMAPLQDARLGAHHDLYLLEEAEGPEALAETLAAAEGERLLASSEYFSRMLRDPARLQALAEALRFRFDVTIYVFLRRQDLQKESGYAQSVKVRRIGSISAEADPAAADEWGANFYRDPDYELVLANLEQAFGASTLRIGVFDTSRPGDILDWFLALAGVAIDDPLRPDRVNESVSRRRTLFLSHMDKPDPRLVWRAFRVIQSTRHIHDDGGRYLLSPSERRAVMRRYLEGNRRIVERYAPEGGEALLAEPPDDPDWTPPEPIRASEFLRVGLALARTGLRDSTRGPAGRARDAALLFGLALEAAVQARSASAREGRT